MDRHLLPDEIELLLDGDVGLDSAPLEAHVRACTRCQAELDEGRRIIEAVEHAPQLDPSPLFAAHVMAQIQVRVPWQVSARDAMERWAERLTPRSRPLRVLAGAGALAVAAVLSVGCVWLLTHLNAALFVAGMLATQLRASAAVVGQWIATTLLGGAGPGAAIAGILGTLVAALMLRSVVAAARRQRPLA
jgi:hypothetical protein